MSGIDGPSGIGGPKGPTGPAEVDGADGVDHVAADVGVDATAATSHTADIDKLAAEVAAGRLTPREAIDQLVEATATPELSPTERAELRELLAALVENDPYFAGLTDRV